MTIPSSVTPVRLREIVAAAGPEAVLAATHDDGDAVAIDDVTHDSRSVRPGTLFACRPGRRSDGHDHAPEAVAAGAAALLVERVLDVTVPQVRVPSVAQAMGPVAAAVHRHPSGEMTLIAVTGTNGKTTTTYLLESVLSFAGHTAGLIGTVQTRVAGKAIPGVRTTPEATDLQRLLRSMRTSGVTAAAMEVSSHGLALGRVRATSFAAGLFTNLTQDHLDFHGDMEEYYAAKRSLFAPAYTPVGVVNVDDEYGRRLADESAVDVVRVSPSGRPADVVGGSVSAGPQGSEVTVNARSGSVRVRVPIPGLFNVANAVLTCATAEAVGIDLHTVAGGIAACPPVPGRMETVDAGQAFTVLVDYAHTPDSLRNLLESLRQVADGRVIVVVGCGGDRDAGKRPLMGRIAAELADLAVFTSDNPRSEDPQAILDAVLAGARRAARGGWTAELDRRHAIAIALAQAGPGDVVVIAGKGHETTQELADRTIAFDDRQVARELLEAAA